MACGYFSEAELRAVMQNMRSELKAELRSEFELEMGERVQRLRNEMNAREQQLQLDVKIQYQSKLQEKLREELSIIRDEMGVIYDAMGQYKSLSQFRAGAIDDFEARMAQRERNVCNKFSAEIDSLRKNRRYLAKQVAKNEDGDAMRISSSTSLSVSSLSAASRDDDRAQFILDLILEWMPMSVLSRTAAASHAMLNTADACWKPFAVHLYPELQLRTDDTAWRSCLVRKVCLPMETPETIRRALINSGENVWKFKNQWHRCECGSLYFIGECGRAVETAHCIECGHLVGGQEFQLVASSMALTHEEADAAAASLRPNISNQNHVMCSNWVRLAPN